MSAPAPGCPPDETWSAFPGGVSGTEQDALRRHLASCAACRTIVAELARQGLVAAVDTTGGAEDGPASVAMAARLDVGARLGRFVVLAPLGEGGMGVVVSAYDPRLERKVALKVLRGNAAGGHARLLREAQALARIAHPNVVPIHEVAELDDQIVIVMEYVAGRTLVDWVRTERPPWREIVRVYVQAGRGLAAAHAAGLVHRDFKPSNALIGADRRVRVIDFGLVGEDPAAPAVDAEAVDPGDPTNGGRDRLRADAPARQPVDRLTRTGTVLGTPAYMAPEQFERADVDPRTDVYAFCVAMTEALYGARPFVGRRPGFVAGDGGEPPTAAAIPRRIWTALRRGLSADRAARPASIEALIDELERRAEPVRRRWTAVAAIAVAGTVAIPLALTRRGPSEPPCSGGAAQVAPIWSPTSAGEVARQLGASFGGYGREVAPRVVGELSRYASDWTGAHRAACLAHRRGEQSAILLDKRMHCLDRGRQALASAVALISHPEGPPGDPIRLILGLPPLASCASLDLLAATEPPPADPDARARLGQLEAALERAAAFERSGDYARADATAAAVVRAAPSLGRERLAASANLLVGRARLLAGDLAAATAPLRAALHHAITADVPEIAAEAIARRIYADGINGGLEPAALAEARALAEDFLGRAHDGGFARALLLNNVGVIYRALGQGDVARTVLRAALTARAAVTRPEPELSVIIENLAAVTMDPEERQALFAQAVREVEASLGPHHPDALRTRLVQAAATPSPRARRDLLVETCGSWQGAHPQLSPDRALCEHALAAAEDELDDGPAAALHYAQAAALHAASDQAVLAEVARGHAEQLAHRAEPCRRAFAAARAKLGPAPTRPWEHALGAEIDAALAELERELGNPREAMRLADAALAALAPLPLDGQLPWQVIAARARVTAARARLALGGHARAVEARGLLEAAARWYRGAGAGYERRVGELDDWLRPLPAR